MKPGTAVDLGGGANMGQVAQSVRCLLLAAAMASTATPVAAQWLVEEVRGTSLTLLDGEWHEARIGDLAEDGSIYRTLRSGRITVGRDEAVISLGGETAVELSLEDRALSVTQYSGSLAVRALTGQLLVAVVTPDMAVSGRTRFSVTVEDGETRQGAGRRRSAGSANWRIGLWAPARRWIHILHKGGCSTSGDQRCTRL